MAMPSSLPDQPSSDSMEGISSMLFQHPNFALDVMLDNCADDHAFHSGGGAVPPLTGSGRGAASHLPADAACGLSPPPPPAPGIPLPRAWQATAGAKSMIIPVPVHRANTVARFWHSPPWRQMLCGASPEARSEWLTELCRLLPLPGPGRKFSKRPLLRCFPRIGGVTIDLYRLYHEVCKGGGLVVLTQKRAMGGLARCVRVCDGGQKERARVNGRAGERERQIKRWCV